jgi:hypothetical protein
MRMIRPTSARYDQFDDPIVQVTVDGAYDGASTYQTIAQHGDVIDPVAGDPASPV